MAVVTMRQMLDAGVHFGHQTRRWNPKMKRFIFTERNGIYIIDLQQTLQYVDRAYEFIRETVAHGGTVLFIGTKRQAQEAIAEQATRVSMPYVNQRWLGGMLTNFQTVHKRLQRLKDLEAMETSGEFEGRTKKEVLLLTREKDKLAKTLGGIRDMAKVPSAVWIVDTKKEHIAVGEARKLGIPVVSIASRSLRRCRRLCTVWKLVSMPPSQRWLTYGMETRVACSAIASCAWRLVPMNSTVPPCATVSRMNS
jgi:small subunit ribosomal protein S2